MEFTFVKRDMPRDVNFATLVKALITLVIITVAYENTFFTVKIKFMLLIRTNTRVACATKGVKFTIIWSLIMENVLWR